MKRAASRSAFMALTASPSHRPNSQNKSYPELSCVMPSAARPSRLRRRAYATQSRCRRGDDTKMLFLSGSIEHGWNIHAKKLRRALQANSRAGSRLWGAAGDAFFEKETR